MNALPLRYRTPDSWAVSVLKDPFALLSDHAYLESKAASNALALLNRWPDPRPKNWTHTLATVARDEATHLKTVLQVLADKGGHLDRYHKSRYAHDLRQLVRLGTGPLEIVDRLLVSALIEARSCERFDLLAKAAKDPKLKQLYKGLYKSESGHFNLFLRLARQVMAPATVNRRWEELLDAEAKIIADQPVAPGIHSGTN